MKTQKPGIYDDYVGTNVYFMLEGVEAGLWLYVTDRGARYAPPSATTACLWIARYERWPQTLVDRLRRAGFADMKDRAGYSAERLAIPVDDIQAAGGQTEQVSYALDRLAHLIAALAE